MLLHHFEKCIENWEIAQKWEHGKFKKSEPIKTLNRVWGWRTVNDFGIFSGKKGGEHFGVKKESVSKTLNTLLGGLCSSL